MQWAGDKNLVPKEPANQEQNNIKWFLDHFNQYVVVNKKSENYLWPGLRTIYNIQLYWAINFHRKVIETWFWYQKMYFHE